MRHSVHQLRIDLMSHAAALFGSLRSRLRAGRRVIHRRVARNRTIQKLSCFADSVRHLTGNHLFAVKAVHWNLRVSCDNDAVSLLDFLRRQHIFCSSGSSCFYFYRTIPCFGCFFNSFRSHICMGNSGRTGCNRQDFLRGRFSRFRIRKPLVDAFLFLIRPVDYGKKFIYGTGIAQRIRKILIHHQHG